MRKEKRVQIILAGIGGQGVLFSSKLFSRLGLRLGSEVMGSETHGMSQRGGSVITHLKIGDFQSPLIRTGAADLLYSLDIEETYRALKFLKAGGICFVNCIHPENIDERVLGYLREKDIILATFDASGTAVKIGSARSANVVLIGFSAGTGLIPFGADDLRKTLELVSKAKTTANNLKAFETGYRQGLEFQAGL